MSDEVLKIIEQAKLSGAEELDLSGSSLQTLPEALLELTGLKKLNLAANELETLPEWLGQMTQLQLLDISLNRISILPDSLSQMTQLHYLYVIDNQLSSLPKSLGQLAQLQELFVSGNQLRSLPESIGQLTQLIELFIPNNQLRALPESIGKLIHLTALNVSHNFLSTIPGSLGDCLELQDLDIAFNNLAHLPKSLANLPLKTLMVQGNTRLCLSKELLGKYKILFMQRIDNNYMPVNPATILEAYFATQEKDGKPLNEVKLLLVGRGAAGKTSIAKRLIKGTFSRSQKETQGIDISKWTLTCSDQQITLNLWDFAGQVITHATHQFFLSSNSVYVLVLTGREDTQKSDADYWLRLIRAFSCDGNGKIAPVLIALNKWDQHPFKLDRNLLLEKYPFIAGFIETDCKSGLGIDELKLKLAETVQSLDFIRQSIKLSWWNIKEALEKSQRRKHYLPYSEFQQICSKYGETDADKQRILAEIFHALGIALNYGHDERLRNTTVLNPRWVTEGIYKLLREAVADDGSAELTLARVAEVLPKEPETMQRYLVELMRRFDLAFPLNETGDRWLVPQRLPAEQPVLSGEWISTADATRLRYKYPVIPEGLLPRFITRTYPLSEGLNDSGETLPRWVNGVVLSERSAKALIRVDSDEREINVVVIGERNARLMLLGVIQADFQVIHDDISGLGQIEELEVEGRPGTYIPVTTLRADENKGQQSSASTLQGTVPLNPTAELNRISEPEARNDRLSRARVFISYSSSDARLKDELLTRLKPMQISAGLIECWHDRLITPGEEWDGIIKTELEQADVILLLVSAKFLASNYIHDVEIQKAVELAETNKAKLVPIVLEHCGWKEETFGRFNALPRKGKPIRDTSPQRNAWYEVEEELRALFKTLRNERELSASGKLASLHSRSL